MSQRYFSKFPLVTYNNQAAVNITERVVVRDFPSKNGYLYYPYDLQNSERPDQLADRLMNDPYLSWTIYLSNGIIDPYYDWFMPDDVFNSYLAKKYGDADFSKIMSRIAYYRNNWYSDSEIITVEQYNSLPDIKRTDAASNDTYDTAKRYYEVVLTGKDITGYRRRRIDDILHTNKMVRYNISGTSSFANNEIVNIQLGYANAITNVYVSAVTGSAQVLSSNSTTVTIQHTSGYVDTVITGYNFTSTNSYIYGTDSKANCTISSYKSLANNIVETETIYWTPVTIYEDEVEKNSRNRTIRLLDSGVAEEIGNKMSESLAALL